MLLGIIVCLQAFAHFIQGVMVCLFGGFFPNLMGDANIVEVSFEDSSIFSESVSPILGAETQVVRCDFLRPKCQTVKGFIKLRLLLHQEKWCGFSFRLATGFEPIEMRRGGKTETQFEYGCRGG